MGSLTGVDVFVEAPPDLGSASALGRLIAFKEALEGLEGAVGTLGFWLPNFLKHLAFIGLGAQGGSDEIKGAYDPEQLLQFLGNSDNWQHAFFNCSAQAPEELLRSLHFVLYFAK